MLCDMCLGGFRWPYGSPGMRFTDFTICGAFVCAPPSVVVGLRVRVLPVSIGLCWGGRLLATASAAADPGFRSRNVVGGEL